MEVVGLFVLLLLVAALACLAMGVAAFVQVRALREEVAALRKRMAPGAASQAVIAPEAPLQPPATSAFASDQAEKARANVDMDLDLDLDVDQPPPEHLKPADAPQGASVWAHIQQQWMVWLGGGCVALAGIFLAKYSIEQDLLGPTARVICGILTGFSLHAAALWLRASQGNHPAFAALAGGGSITLFAALLAALHFYQLFSPLTVFSCLAVVAVATMWLALLHGPVLAAIGMLGAYSVPLLVSTGSGNLLLAMLYALIITASVLWLTRYVYRPWLWWGLVGGGLGWWLISLTSVQPDGWRPAYLLLLAYGLVAVPTQNWLLQQRHEGAAWPLAKSLLGTDREPLYASLVVIVAAFGVTILHSGWDGSGLTWLLLPAFWLVLAGRQPRFATLAWAGYWVPTLALLLTQVHMQADGQWALAAIDVSTQGHYVGYVITFAALCMGAALVNLQWGKALNWWSAMIAVIPVLQLLQGYLLATSYLPLWQWSLVAFALGAGALWLAFVGRHRLWPQALVVWLLLAGHFAYTLLVVWLLDEASLTLAIAVQLMSLAWVMRRFSMPDLGWLFKCVAVLVVVRLTFNPWLASYDLGHHWTLWTYAGATLSCIVATRWLMLMPQLARWSEAAALHLFVLTVWIEARYWLHQGAPFSDEFVFADAILNQALFAALAVVYQVKSTLTERLVLWYRGYSRLLLALSAGNYALLVAAFLTNSVWAWGSVGQTPVLNLLLLAYGLPIGLAWLIYRYYDESFRRAALLAAAAAALAFITIEIRHLWQGSIALTGGVQEGEMYTYSAAWLACAVAALLGGSWRYGPQCYRAGMALLAVVIVKIFMVDMADLEGLWRVASFMGLGIALLGVAFLHQKIQAAPMTPRNQ